MSRHEFPHSLLFREGGHLTEEALAALADGEDELLPVEVGRHLETCEACARELGDTAMLAASVHTALGRAFAQDAGSVAAVPSRPSTLWALAFGLGFAAIGALPFLTNIPGWLFRAAVIVRRAFPVLAHGAISLAAEGGLEVERMALTLASLAVLMMSILAVSRLTPREGVAR
jgi:hypothetical protein